MNNLTDLTFCLRTVLNRLSLGLVLIAVFSCSRPETIYNIGVSQCSDDAWRHKFNNEIRREAQFYPGVEVEIRSADDDNVKQIADIQYFIDKKVDLLIVAPNESEPVSEAVESAYDSGIPVILVDRTVYSEKYTAFIGADNRDIGRQAGEYLCRNVRGRVLELTGLAGSSAAVERAAGFRVGIAGNGTLKLVGSAGAGWTQDIGEKIADSLFNVHGDINAVFAHNDRLAAGARKVAQSRGMDDIVIVGIDAIPGQGNGLDMVMSGVIDASFIYPTGGDKVIELAMRILRGEDYEKENVLETALVDSSNARVMLMQTSSIEDMDEKMNILQAKVDEYLTLTSLQKMFLIACIVIVVLLSVLLGVTVSLLRENRRAKRKLEEMNLQLEEANVRIEEATNAKLSFFTNVSHDFRTPLTLVADPVNQLIKSPDLGENERFLLNIAHKNVTVLLRLVSQILDFRKYESGKLVLSAGSFRIDEALRDWMSAFDSLARVKHIDFGLELGGFGDDGAAAAGGASDGNAAGDRAVSDAGAGGANAAGDAGGNAAGDVSAGAAAAYNIVADREKVERIVYNLLSNAFKFTPERGRIKVGLSRKGENIVITVSDNGSGIPAEHIRNIFNSFYQADVHHSGSGIGLMLSKAFAQLHGGDIEVESLVGQGSMFTVTLPVVAEGASALDASGLASGVASGTVSGTASGTVSGTAFGTDLEAGETSSSNGEETSQPMERFRQGAVYDAGEGGSGLFSDEEILDSKKTVLIIDDNSDIRSYVRSFLSFEYNIIEAPEGKEGIRLARKYVPDAIICDVMMPGMDGMECCRILKSDISTSHIPVLMLTAYAAEDYKIKGYECGADSYISKPFSSDLLVARLDNLINSRKMLSEVFGDGAKANGQITQVDKGFMDRLKEIINSRLSDPELTVESICEEIGLGRVQLYRKTKSLIGYSPNEFLRICRLRKASSLLKSTEKSVSEVAYSVGFSSPSYFAKCYREYFGENPNDTKKQ